jgi:uncharacterized lipoprotein YddW (UPF0748 family)
MTLYPLVLVLGLTGLPEQTIDAFPYPDVQAASRAWSVPKAGRLAVVEDQGRKVVQVALPFASQPTLERIALDRHVKLDLSVPGGFEFEAKVDPPAAVGHFSLYFHAGAGWYHASVSLGRPGWQTFRVSKAAFGTEETPGGWQQVDTIRIAAWRAQPKDGTLRIRRLASQWHPIALVVPAAESGRGRGEATAAAGAAKQVAPLLSELGLGCDAVDEEAVARGALGDRKVAILAYNPHLGDEAIAALEKFVAGGGKLIACYSLPERLARLLGMKRGKYLRPERAGQFAEMRFDTAGMPGMPKSVRQASWNISVAEPAGPETRVVGRWFDDAGGATGQPALLVSKQGAYFTHLILPDDREGKKELLAGLVGSLWPDLWRQMAVNTLEAGGEVGHLQTLDELRAYVAKQGVASSRQCLDRGLQALQAARAQCQAGVYFDALRLARIARQQLSESYLRAATSVACEGRAVWNHSGTGAYAGDWERSARELSQAGFNMVLPNMLWAGVAHYASDVLPRSATYDRYGDQIAECVTAAHRHGIEVHVWKVNWNLANAPKTFVEKMRAAGRTMVTARGKPQDWLCPSHPENLKLEAESMLEVARKYAVDGLHFDYIRYPGGDCCYCDGCRQRFEVQSGRPVVDWPKACVSGPRLAEYRVWRCQQITRLVERVSREGKQIRPGLKISAAVFSAYPGCRESVGQDWVAWVRAGYLDFLCPMDYTNSDLAFATLVENQLRLIERKIPMYPGIGATSSSSTLEPDRVAGQIDYARRLGASGFTIFNYQESTARGIIPVLALGPTSKSAAVPHRGK